MINSEYPLCIECEFCVTRDGEGKQRGETFFDCYNDIITKIDVVSGKQIISSCYSQRKPGGLEKFGIPTDEFVCGLVGKYFKEKTIEKL